ncbi:beta-propeller fold lactonase family protein [Cerasicoccus frondis]|uniref:beta-propeller fold lactonase family protein n=1 Tax=Cerasicoccus frondis TaxID=490090 RepID=UPI002852D5E9|nr:beta-propeller fold lactonase family protein [Cerasicoccus frondis]
MKLPTFTLLLALALSEAAGDYVHYEARQTRPIVLSPDGQTILALNSPDARLSVFNVGNADNPAPVLIREIPVGLEPVALAARNDDEVWVVNELSDSISVVSLNRRAVIATLPAPDEPADILIAGDRAYVTCARSNELAVFDVTTRKLLTRIPLEGLLPRALAISPDGAQLYAAFFHSGNNTTTLNFRDAPAQPAPDNPELPTAPKTALIVTDTDSRISYDVIDHDIAVIDTERLEVVDYIGGVGTNLFSLATLSDGSLWAGHTEARNLIRFEPALNGVFASSRIGVINGDDLTLIALNPFDDQPFATAAEKAQALAQPLAFAVDENTVWLAAYGSDRVAELSNDGEVLRIIDLRANASVDSSQMRGPRGLALGPHNRLFVLNKLSNTVSVIDRATGAVVAETPAGSYDPTPDIVRRGRSFFNDARLSGNGTVSCASCHLDADRDGIAWDLGDPGGELEYVIGYDLSIDETEPVIRTMHPMKGPMVTQSLRGLKGQAPFHWRGDRPAIQDFNPSFENLQAGEQLNSEDIDAVAAYLESIAHHPNPNLQLDRSLPETLNGADPLRGQELFIHPNNLCSACHTLPESTNHNLDLFTSVLSTQPVKNASLRLAYQKNFYTPQSGQTLSGFGYGHDGAGPGLPSGHEYDIDILDIIENGEADVSAFVLSIDTGTAPTVGYTLTLSGDATPSPDELEAIELLESRDAVGDCELVVRGVWQGRMTSWRFDAEQELYLPDSSRQTPINRSELINQLNTDDSLTFLGAPIGQGDRLGGDRNQDGILDQDEPKPDLEMCNMHGQSLASWPNNALGWRLETTPSLRDEWSIVTDSIEQISENQQGIHATQPRQFFRLTRTW